jgi:hypothetical protein
MPERWQRESRRPRFQAPCTWLGIFVVWTRKNPFQVVLDWCYLSPQPGTLARHRRHAPVENENIGPDWEAA